MINVNAAQTPSSNKGAEWIRVLMPIIIIVILFVIANKFIKNILKPIGDVTDSLNITDTKEEKAAKKALQDNLNALNKKTDTNPFNPLFYKNLAKKINPNTQRVVLATVAAREALSKQIYDAIGYLYDSPEKIEGAFKQLSYKSQISHLADHFQNKYKTDLLSFGENVQFLS
jgi:hypothetical protein